VHAVGMTKTICIFFEDRGDVEILVELEWADGTHYPYIERMLWDDSGFTAEEKKQIDSLLESKKETWERYMFLN
jgi:hypothetical protein